MVTVYRSGFITPSHEIGNPDAMDFDSLAVDLTGKQVDRNNSLFACLDAQHTLDFWARYRSGQRNQACVYAVTYPEELLASHEVYAYEVGHYDNYFASMLESDEVYKEAFAEMYVESRIHATRWGTIHDSNKYKYEVLIPYEVAVQGHWEMIACRQAYCGHLDEAIPAEHLLHTAELTWA